VVCWLFEEVFVMFVDFVGDVYEGVVVFVCDV